MPKYFDTHAHVNFNAFKDDADQVLEDCLSQGAWVVNVGTQKDTSVQAVEMAKRFNEGIYASVGLHPMHLFSQHVDEEESSFHTREEKFDSDFYTSLANSPKVVAIGECGLDYFRLPSGDEQAIKSKQRDVFEQHIALAAKSRKTLMVHCRDAYDDLHKILKKERSKVGKVIIHSFIGGLEDARKFIELDCYLSFNGIVTYKPRKELKPGGSSPQLYEVVREAPMSRILLETDCPYLTPEPKRGQRNSPLNLSFIALKIAELKKMPAADIARQTTENALAALELKTV
ncbi:MAG: hypothetical protein A2722_03855 [Candidatus Doudnabacteria bacterium RIFCSPHIGHO2_01_FULL_50_11]|uniref:Hydrolase TatD n=1 Tax=Candidatus Doudnabacteria bacterium RIFCSPHIGHO2_01_FULL_50_11 TaxID=1817828 RepID=A0A1F5PEJ4_9BACT|nr:MAG: hypothetical protein A2722_03855 [Candidatus Doudnabacteria bacterium RIFCSPHIGHO2_01_FULL_50_11]HLC45115.1 TatD family hydrolase [Patescibacteria group bacterium]